MFQFRYFHVPKNISRAYCTKILHALSEVIESPQEWEVHLIVVSPEEIQKLNESCRGVQWPTDILTFSYLPNVQRTTFNVQATSVAGEIYLCLEKIQFYAEERGDTMKDAIYSTIIHWLVHLMGYDHETEEEYEVMRGVEMEVERKLNW